MRQVAEYDSYRAIAIYFPRGADERRAITPQSRPVSFDTRRTSTASRSEQASHIFSNSRSNPHSQHIPFKNLGYSPLSSISHRFVQ